MRRRDAGDLHMHNAALDCCVRVHGGTFASFEVGWLEQRRASRHTYEVGWESAPRAEQPRSGRPSTTTTIVLGDACSPQAGLMRDFGTSASGGPLW